MLPLHVRLSALALVVGIGLTAFGLNSLLADSNASARPAGAPIVEALPPAPTTDVPPAAVESAPTASLPPAEVAATPTAAVNLPADANLVLPEAKLPPRPRPTGRSRAVAAPDPAPTATPIPTTYKWIDVNITKQTITAYEGSKPIKTVPVSTGIATHPTIVGRFNVYVKLTSQLMTGGSRAAGDYYYLPDVPNVMYFYAGFAIHGTYWHHNFGHPMSHGCVNLSLTDAKWFYDWTPEGTTVVTHF